MASMIDQSLRSLRFVVAGVGLLSLALPAPGADSSDIDDVLGGTWEFSTIGTTAGMSTRPQDYTQVRRVHFANGAFDTNPLGFVSQGFRLVSCEPGGAVSFDAPYVISGCTCSMTFKGQADDHLTHLSGAFTFCMASGTFTATHLAAEPEQAQLSLALGLAGAASVHLTLKPDAPIRVHGVRVRGDSKLVVAPVTLTFTPENWNQGQELPIDATAVKATGKAIVGIVGPGVPETYLAVKLVRPVLTAH